jgi:MFS family permease
LTPEADPTGPVRQEVDSETPSVTVGGERLILLTVILGVFLAPLNSTMIAVALPDIMLDLDVGISSAGWLITAYLIAMASLQPLAGKLGDNFGYRAMILSGLAVFGLVSVGAGLAPTLPVLLVFRVLQAVSAAVIVPSGSALFRQLIPAHRRGAAFGMLGAGVAVAAALGRPVGGVLVGFAGWRSIFYVNLIFVVPALMIGMRKLSSAKIDVSKRVFDVYGAIVLPILLVASAWILISFSKGANPWVIGFGVPMVVVGAIAFGRYEKHHPDLMLQLNFFRQKVFRASAAGIGFANLSMYSLLVSIPLLLASRDDSSLRIGLVLFVMSAGMVVSSYAGGRLIDRVGRRLPTTTGLVMLAVGVLPIAFAGEDVSIATLLMGLSLVGLGLGLSTPGLQTSAVEAVESNQAGSAAGLYSTSRYLGSITGSAVIAGIVGASDLNVDGLGLVFLMSFVAAVAAGFVSLGLKSRPDGS